MSVAKGRRQFVIVDRPAALAGRPADWRETSLRPPLSATKWIVGYSDVMCGRRDLNPHGPCGPTDFHTQLRLSPPPTAFAMGFGVWTIPSPCPDWFRVSGAARLVSTPSRPVSAGLGSGSPFHRVPR